MANIWQDMNISENKNKSKLTLSSTYAGILSAYLHRYKTMIMYLNNDIGADSP